MQKFITKTKGLQLRRKNDRGASAVEFALVLPIFLLLLLALIQYGTIFLLRNQLTEAASDAARNSVTSTSASTAANNALIALSNDIIHNGVGLISSSNGCSSTGFTCTITPVASGSAGCQNAPPVGYECLQVTVSYDYADHPVLALPFLPTPSSVSASSTVIIGNGALVQ